MKIIKNPKKSLLQTSPPLPLQSLKLKSPKSQNLLIRLSEAFLRQFGMVIMVGEMEILV
jgi:hypothetical protein